MGVGGIKMSRVHVYTDNVRAYHSPLKEIKVKEKGEKFSQVVQLTVTLAETFLI